MGFFLSHRQNDAFRAVNRLQKAGEEVCRLQQECAVGEADLSGGHLLHPAQGVDAARCWKRSPPSSAPRSGGVRPHRVRNPWCSRRLRVGLWDRYGGSMPSGWTRWLLEQFEFPFRVVYAAGAGQGGSPREVRRADPGRRGVRGARRSGRRPSRGRRPARRIPRRRGERTAGRRERPLSRPAREITAQTTVPQLKEFLEDGGTVLTIGGSTRLGQELGLPVANHLAEARRGWPGAAAPIGEVLRTVVGLADPRRPSIPWPGAWATRWT